VFADGEAAVTDVGRHWLPGSFDMLPKCTTSPASGGTVRCGAAEAICQYAGQSNHLPRVWSASGTHPALSNEDPIACNNRPSSVAARGSIDAEIDLMKSQQERQMGDGAF